MKCIMCVQASMRQMPNTFWSQSPVIEYIYIKRKSKKRIRKTEKKNLIVLISSTLFFFADRVEVCSELPQFSVPEDCWHLSLHHGRSVLDLIKKLTLWHFDNILHIGMVGTHQRTCQCSATVEARQSSAELLRGCAS